MLLNALRLLLRLAGWGVLVTLALVAVVAVVAVAWLPFNLGDAEPKPRPAELQLPAPRVPDERNVAYAFEGFLAEAGRDPAQVGRSLREVQRTWVLQPPALRASAAGTGAARSRELLGRSPTSPKGAPLHCTGQAATCDASWMAQAAALETQRASYGVLGERCDRLLESLNEFEELLPLANNAEAPVMNWLPANECSRWFRSGAVVALSRGKRDEALAQVRRADRLHHLLWQGSRTLLGHMVSTRLARNTYDTMVAMALREPALAEPLVALLAAPLDTRTGARRWLLAETAFQQALLSQLGKGASMATAFMAPLPDGMPLAWRGLAGQAIDGLAGRGIGYQRERTRQRLDAQAQRTLAHLQYEWPAVIAGAVAESRAASARGPWRHLSWRNTFGEKIVSEATGDAVLLGYYARHADHELHRQAAALALTLQRQRVAPAQRAEASRKLPGTSDLLKDRMSWSSDGRTLTVKPWQAEIPGGIYDPRRDAITFSWP